MQPPHRKLAAPPQIRPNHSPDIIHQLEKNSFFQLARSAEQQTPLLTDLHLADEATSFYPHMMKHLKSHASAAFKAQSQFDFYGFQAQVTVVPGAGALPLPGGGLMLLPRWSHQMLGKSFVFSLRAERIQQLQLEMVVVAENWQKLNAMHKGDSPVSFSLSQIANPFLAQSAPMEQQIEGENIFAVANILWRSGVSHRRLTQC